jgi:hypothetical protein
MPCALIAIAALASTLGPWAPLRAGVEYAKVEIRAGAPLHIVRIDPKQATIVARAKSAGHGESVTAAEWSRRLGAVAVINAGMYETDYSTHTGLMWIGAHRNNARWVGKYKSVLLLGPPGVSMIRDASALPADAGSWSAIVQNLRLIRGPGRNVWSKTEERWSEAAVAMDRSGRLLFLFCRTPLSMFELNQALLNAGLGITHAQHLEGGPEASLSVHGSGIDLDLNGSFETGFNENDASSAQYPLPNVLAVLR